MSKQPLLIIVIVAIIMSIKIIKISIIPSLACYIFQPGIEGIILASSSLELYATDFLLVVQMAGKWWWASKALQMRKKMDTSKALLLSQQCWQRDRKRWTHCIPTLSNVQWSWLVSTLLRSPCACCSSDRWMARGEAENALKLFPLKRWQALVKKEREEMQRMCAHSDLPIQWIQSERMCAFTSTRWSHCWRERWMTASCWSWLQGERRQCCLPK